VRYLYNWLLLIDQAVNVLLLGDPSETLSMRMGRSYYLGNMPLPARLLMLVTDLFFLVVFKEMDHCRAAARDKKLGDRELWRWHDGNDRGGAS